MRQTLIALLLYTIVGCKVFYSSTKKDVDYIFYQNTRSITINGDTIRHHSYQNIVYCQKEECIFTTQGAFLFKTNLNPLKLDSIKYAEIDSADGFYLDDSRDIIVAWQKAGEGVFESYYVDNIENYIHYFLRRPDIEDISYSPKFGLIFILSNFYINNYTLSIYPMDWNKRTLNKTFKKNEKNIPIGENSKIIKVEEEWILVGNPNTGKMSKIYINEH